MKKEIRFTIIPTYNCNMFQECTYCYAKDLIKEFGDIEIDDFKKVVDWLSEEYNKVEVVLIGGEPTLHPKFDEMLDYMSQKVKSSKLYTNCLFNENILDRILNAPVLRKFNVHYDPSYIKSQKLKDRFLNNLEQLSKTGRQINLRFNISSSDFEYSELLQLAQKYNSLILYSISAPGGKNNNYVPLEYVKDFALRINEFIKEAEKLNIKLKSARPLPFCAFEESGCDLDYITKCGGVKGSCQPYKAMNPNMTMLGCSSLIDYKIIQINNKEDFLNGLQKFEEHIEDLKWNKPSIDKCIECEHFISKRCQGGCLTYKGKFFNQPLDGGCVTGCSMSFYDRH